MGFVCEIYGNFLLNMSEVARIERMLFSHIFSSKSNGIIVPLNLRRLLRCYFNLINLFIDVILRRRRISHYNKRKKHYWMDKY